MTILLLFLMAYQVTGEVLHEWIGIGMTVLVIVHQILNRKWYGALFKGRYRPYRILTTAVNVLLLLSFALTAFCGMSMSGHAVPFLYGMAPVSFARRMHLSMSHWSFVLMGLHLGLHIPAMTAKMKLEGKTKTIVSAAFCCIAGIGLWLFLRSNMKLYDWLLNHPKLGPYIRNFMEHKAIPLKIKILSVSLVWITLLNCAIFVADHWLFKTFFIVLAAGITIHILSYKTLK
jgi:uncharacterized membrane protein YbaN (DUF454 family)